MEISDPATNYTITFSATKRQDTTDQYPNQAGNHVIEIKSTPGDEFLA